MSNPPSLSPQLQAVLAFLDALSSYDLNTLAASITPTYTHTFLPASLSKELGWPEVFEREPFLEAMDSSIWKMITGLKIIPVRIIEANDAIVIHGRAPAGGAKGTITGTPYTQEYMNIYTVERQKDGSYLLADTQETLDSKMSVAWFSREAEALARAKADK